MNFYRDVAPYYQHFFPLAGAKVDFLCRLLRECRAEILLDLACGAGELSLALSGRGFRVVGMDSEEEFFTNPIFGHKPSSRASFVVGRMEELPFYRSQTFDAIICTGNSLPHLQDTNTVKSVLDQCSRLLQSSGRLCIQMMDFALVRARGELVLPELAFQNGGSGETIRLKRVYTCTEDGAAFTPALSVGGSFKSYLNPMCPVEYDELWQFLVELGLTHDGTYGDFSGRVWRGKTPSYITIAKKSP